MGCSEDAPRRASSMPAASAQPGPDAGPSIIEHRSTRWPTFPCTQCHEHTPGQANPRERELSEFHAARAKLDHGDLEGWCYRCHSEANLNELMMPDGTTVPFDRSTETCGGCHGDKMTDWRRGIHGLRTGSWNGPQVVRACAHCHNPHQPRFPAMIAEPAPPPPRTHAKEASR